MAKGSNTAVYATSGGRQLQYTFDDWGATLGRWGGFFSRDKWNPEGYSGQTSSFVRSDGATIRWGYHGKHNADITSGIRLEDVQWLVTYLSGVTDEELRAGLQASGANSADTDTYVRSIRQRISQLQHLADGVKSAR